MEDAGFGVGPLFDLQQAKNILQATIDAIQVEGYKVRAEHGSIGIEAPDGDVSFVNNL